MACTPQRHEAAPACAPSELEAHARGGSEGGGVDVAVRQAVLHAAKEGAQIGVKALVEAIVEYHRPGVLRAAAGGADLAGAARRLAGGEGVLPVPVVGRAQLKSRSDRPLHPAP